MELSIKDIFILVLNKWWIIFLCIALFSIAAVVYSTQFSEPVYEANTTLYVGKNVEETGLDSTSLYIGEIVVSDYKEIAKSRLVASAVIDDLKLEGMTVNKLSKKINVEQRKDTRVIEISVTDTDPQMAMIIANKVAEVLREKIIKIMQLKNVQVIDTAILPTEPVSLSSTMILIIMSAAGLIIGFFIILLTEYFDNTIRTPEDIKKYLNLPVIGTIPAFKSERKEG